MRAKSWALAVMPSVLICVLAGCGGMHGMGGMGGKKPSSMAPSAGMPSGRHTMPDGTVMGGKQMPPGSAQPASSDGQPSAVAAMICSNDTADAVEKTFGLRVVPHRTAVWSAPVYRCQYALAGGGLKLTVADLDAAGPGSAWFSRLRHRLPAAKSISGMQSLGFPAFETSSGDVVFLKDHKTLWVDASGLRRSELPAKFSRTDAAYHVAASVIACWSK